MVLAAVAVAAAVSVPGALARTQPHFRSAKSAVAEYGPAARKRLAPAFRSAGVAYPPAKVMLAAIKDDQALEVWASRHGAWHYIRTYRILGTSGHAGPKLREGDRQIPEGVYHVETLSANTAFHLAMLLDYPNSFDREHAMKDGRTNLGGSIFIHGGSRSVGCLAMGDRTAEDLFVLAADTGLQNVTVVIAPSDPRTGPLRPTREDEPSWLPELYETIGRQFTGLPRPRPTPAASVNPTPSATIASSRTTTAYAQRTGPGGGEHVIAIVYGLLAGLVLGISAFCR